MSIPRRPYETSPSARSSKKDSEGHPYIIRYNKIEDTHYLASEKEGKKTGNTATHNGTKWVEIIK